MVNKFKIGLSITVAMLFILSTVKGQGSYTALNDIADMAMLTSIGVDVVDQALQVDDRLKDIHSQMKATERLLNDPNYMKYTSGYARSKSLRKIQNQAKTVQIYAITLRNLLDLTRKIIKQGGDISFAKIKNQIDQYTAMIESTATGTLALGSGNIGGADADVIAKLEDNKISQAANQIQGLMLEILLEIDKFNRVVEEMYNDVLEVRMTLERSFGVGVLFAHTSNMNLQEFTQAYYQKQINYGSRKAIQMAQQEQKKNEALLKQMQSDMTKLFKQYNKE